MIKVNEAGIRDAVVDAMSTLTTAQLRELVMEPYRNFHSAPVAAAA